MDQAIKEALFKAVEGETFSNALKMKLTALDLGYSTVEMTYDPALMNNIYQMAHGGVIFSLMDEAFQLAAQSHGTIAVALSVSVTYVNSPEAGARLCAEAREISRSKRTANYDIKVTDQDGRLIAVCQALAFLTGKRIPFI